MNDQVKCPHCGKIFAMTQAISHLVEKTKQEFEQKTEKIREEARRWRSEQIKKLEEENIKKKRELEGQLRDKIKKEMQVEIKDKSNEIGELRKQNESQQEQLLELNKLMRQVRNENEKRRLDMEKKLFEKEEVIRIEEKKKASEENRLKFLDYEKKIQDVSKANEDLKRKLEQGSQQLQGDVLEKELKDLLHREFPYDELKDVPTGIKGADVLQVVKNNYGKMCGTIVWESKRTKAWSDGWIVKLKQDQRQVKAEIAVIISQVLPQGIKNIGYRNGVWIGDYESIVSLALLLRNTLNELALVKTSVIGKLEKKEILWNYLTSVEFRQRLEAMYDSYQQSKANLDKEKEFFRRKWAREEKSSQLLMENLFGIHGDLQAIIGKSLPELNNTGMLASGQKLEKNNK